MEKEEMSKMMDSPVSIDASELTSSAARAFSRRLRSSGNEASWPYYLRKSKELAGQMD